MSVSIDADIRIVGVPPEGPLFDAVVELGDRSRGTLGFFPRAAFKEKAAKGTVIGVVLSGHLVGYVCFDLTRQCLRLIHLCVDPDLRGRGIARKLVEHLQHHYAEYPGIVARCRNNYGLAAFWSELGFRQRTEVKGRSNDGHPLTVWWLDHGHPTLFSELAAEPLLYAAVDLCVVRDLASDAGRPEAFDTQTLIADHVAGRLQMVSTPVLSQEIDSLEDERTRLPCVRFLGRLSSGHPVRADAIHLEQQLIAAARQKRRNYPAGNSDQFDARHVAATAAADISVFITRDERLIDILGAAAADAGVKVLTPADVVAHLDELAGAAAFRPAALAGTGYRLQRLGAGHDTEVSMLANTAEKESPRRIVRRWRNAALAGHERIGVYSPEGNLVVAWVEERTVDRLHIPLLRVGSHRLADTLARQVLFSLRTRAREARLPVVVVSDPHLTHPVRAALADDGFSGTAGAWHAHCVDTCADSLTVEAEAVRAARRCDLPEPIRLRSGMPAVTAAVVERAWWPAKIIDADMPCYLISIRQQYASELFGLPATLFERDADLGLSREHVYYRASRPALSAPARILWYMSGTGQAIQQQGVFACSQLDDVVTGPPDELYERYRHLGVWDLWQVRLASPGGKCQALRFSNTELFPATVPLTRLRAMGQTQPQGPLRIAPERFAAIYREGLSGG